MYAPYSVAEQSMRLYGQNVHQNLILMIVNVIYRIVFFIWILWSKYNLIWNQLPVSKKPLLVAPSKYRLDIILIPFFDMDV